MIPGPHFFRLNAQVLKPVNAILLPVCKPLQIRSRLAEKFQLHLLKFSGPECKVAGRNLIPEGFSDLTDTEGKFLS